MADETIYEMIMERLPPDVADSLTLDQKSALLSACKPVSWQRHPVNLRLTFPIGRERYFVTLVSGVERRSPERRVRDALIYPVMTGGNMLFLLGVGLALCAATVLAVVISSHLLHL